MKKHCYLTIFELYVTLPKPRYSPEQVNNRQSVVTWVPGNQFRTLIKMTTENLKIVKVDVKDIRFPTSLGLHGSDAMVKI